MRYRFGSSATKLLAAAAVWTAPLLAETPADQSDTLSLSKNNNRLSVGVHIDEQGPYDFVVDTGAERTVISRELATKLSLKAGNQVTVHSMTGSGLVDTAMITTLRVDRRPINNIAAPALAEVNLGAHGMLGTDTLRKQRVLFDFGKRQMTISRSLGDHRVLGDNAIVVTARSLYGRLIVADARVEGERVVVVIDTGSDVTIANNALRERLIRKQKLGKGQPITLIGVLGNSMAAQYTAMRRVTFGGIRLENMPVAFSDVDLFRQLNLDDRPALLLGMDTLQLFDRVSIDFATKRVEFLSPYIGGGAAPTRLAMR